MALNLGNKIKKATVCFLDTSIVKSWLLMTLRMCGTESVINVSESKEYDRQEGV